MQTTTDDKNRKLCCFGRVNVRKGTRIIATFYMITGVILLFLIICSITVISGIVLKIYVFEELISQYPYLKMQLIMNSFNNLFVGFVFLYFNYCLRKATYENNVENIKHWLLLNLTNILYLCIYIGYIVAEKTNIAVNLVFLKIIVCVIMAYFQFVVHSFYRDELDRHSASVADNNTFLPKYILFGDQLP